MTQNEHGAADYQNAPPKRKSRAIWWIIGGIVLAVGLLGTCVRGGVKMFAALGERSDASLEFAKRVMEDGPPPMGDEIYAQDFEATQPQIDKVQRIIEHFGQVTEYGTPTCSLRSSANLDKSRSGTFADCVIGIETEHSPGRISINWKRDEEAWKVLGFRVNYLDQSVLLDKADQADRQSEAADADAE